MTVVEVRLLGPVDVVVDGQPLQPSAAKVRMLLAILALDASTPVSTEVLADRLWSGDPPASAASVVRTYVSQLRRLAPVIGERLERSDEGYSLRLEADELDTTRFTALADTATKPGCTAAESAGLLRHALSLWRGQPLMELGDDARAQAVAAGLEERRWAVVEALAQAELDLGLHASVVGELEAEVVTSPLREQLVARLMLALYRSGRQADALATYQRLRRALLEELGLEPSTELRQLEVAILAQDPVLDSPARRPGNLPTALTSFVGREREVADLAAACSTQRLVTLTGPGGSGKTRLAVEVGRLATEWPDGVWFVDLAARREPGEVVPAVLAALGVDERPGEDELATLLRALADRGSLLILDNCEHLAPRCAAVVCAVLAAAPKVSILATSRTPLGIAGELVHTVAPLAAPDPSDDAEASAASPAGRLLADRIAAARGGHPPSPKEWPAAAELCRRLDGLPLAIELIAAQAGTLSVDELVASTPAQVLRSGGAPVGPAHHRSLVACVRWGVDLLDDEDRQVLERVVVLPGTFSAGAAAAVAGDIDEAEVLQQLARLARQSLLERLPGTPSRFRVLETVRQVVRADLDDAGLAAALDGLVEWAATWGKSVEPALRGPDGVRILDALDAERHALYAALEHGLGQADPSGGVHIAASISALWSYRGYLSEGRHWLTRALAVSDVVEPSLRARLLIAAGTHELLLGDHDTFRLHTEAALDLARRAGEAEDVLRVLLWSGHAAALHGDDAGAGSLYEEALRLALGAADSSAVGSALAGLGDVAAARDDLDTAASFHLRALAAFRAAADAHGEGQALLNVAEVDRKAGRAADATRRFREAAAAFGAIADRSCITASQEGLARVAYDAGRLDEAEQLYRAAIDVRSQLDQPHARAIALAWLARVLADTGRPREAAAALGAAGRDDDPLATRLRSELGDRDYLAAWADGSSSRAACDS